MKKIIYTIALFTCFLQAQTTSIINIDDFEYEGKKYGATPNNAKYADSNYVVIRKAIEIVNKTRQYGIVYIPDGTWFTNELLQSDGIDFRYVYFKGEGKRNSVLKLANNRNKPIIRTSLYFESYIRDIQFDGNKDNNKELEYVLEFISSHCYTIDLNNVYIKYYAKKALLLDNVTHFTLNQFDAKYGGVAGIDLINCLSVVINHPDIEINSEYGIKIQSSPEPERGAHRYKNPHIKINEPYFEKTPIGILLKGVCNVGVEGGYNKDFTLAKVTSTNDNTGFSHYNKFDGRQTGSIIIDKGNYGNTIVNGTASFVDLNGKNSKMLNTKINNWKRAVKLNMPNHVNHDVDYKSDNIKIVSKSPNTASSTYIYASPNTRKLYLKVKGDLNCRVLISVYDQKLKKYYNFSTSKIQKNYKDFNTKHIMYTDGSLQQLQIPINLKDMEQPRIRVMFSSKSKHESVCEFFGYKLTNN